MENSKILLERAMDALKSNGVPNNEWAVGGGTVLAHYFNHRLSKDIDIFLANRQYLNGLSPRINELSELALDYQEQSGFISLTFPEGKIDFIVAPNLTGFVSCKNDFLGYAVYLEDAVEIVIKKLFYRGEFLISRDIFDLAVVSNSSRHSELIEQLVKLGDKFIVFKNKFEQEKKDLENNAYSKIYRESILNERYNFNGSEIEICSKIILEVQTYI